MSTTPPHEHPEDPIVKISENLSDALRRQVDRMVKTLWWVGILIIAVIGLVVAGGMIRLSRAAQVIEVQQTAIHRNKDAIEAVRVDRLVREQQYLSLKSEIKDVGKAVIQMRSR
jgi:hypothetical protein